MNQNISSIYSRIVLGLYYFYVKLKSRRRSFKSSTQAVAWPVSREYFCQFVNLLMAVFECGLLHWPLFYAWLVLQRIPYASLCLGHTVMCSWYSTGTKIPTGRSRISFVYIRHLSLRREENCDIVCCCVRDSIALFKRLLRFWATFWNDIILARKQTCIIIIMIYTYLSKHVPFPSILLQLYKYV